MAADDEEKGKAWIVDQACSVAAVTPDACEWERLAGRDEWKLTVKMNDGRTKWVVFDSEEVRECGRGRAAARAKVKADLQVALVHSPV